MNADDQDSDGSNPSMPQPALAGQAVAHLLRPLARLMIDHGLQHQAMVEMLKKALVEEAVAQFAPSRGSASDTRIALQTGVHRKDVRRIREDASAAATVPAMMSVASQVVARWISEPRFLSADRKPLPLARTPRVGDPGKPDFTTLVAEVSRDVGARAVLDELERMGVVFISVDGWVSLKDTAFVPQEGMGEAFHFVAANLGDHMATVASNVSPRRSADPMLDQSAFAAGLSRQQAAELERAARALWKDALQQFLLSAAVAEERSALEEGAKHRVRFGAYFFQGEDDPSPPSSTSDQPARRHKRKPLP
jgi:hypothetical protein